MTSLIPSSRSLDLWSRFCSPVFHFGLRAAAPPTPRADTGDAMEKTYQSPRIDRSNIGLAGIILANAPNGASRTKTDHPALPMTAEEIARTAAAIAEAGAAMIHVHVRDAQGRHLLDAEAYRDVTAAIRAAVGDRLIVQVTTEAGGRYQPPEQMRVIRELRPEAVSLAIRELIADEAAEPAAADFLAWARRERVMTQIILYDADEVRRYHGLKARGVIPSGNDFPLFVLGRYSAGQTSAPADLDPFLAAATELGLGDPSFADPWSMCAFGRHENACAAYAAAKGGHVRVGFENNLWLPDGTVAPDNAALVRLAAGAVTGAGRALATADQARALMAI